MPYLDERYAADAYDAAPAMAPEAQQFTAGKVNWGRDPAWYAKGGNFTPNDLLPTAAVALGGLAGAAQAGARGLAWEGIKQGGSELAKRYLADPAERMFDAGSKFIGGPDGGMPRWAQAALAAAGIGGGHALYRKLFGDEQAPATPTNSGVGVSAPMAARVLQNRNDQIEAATDMNTLSPEAFRAKWGQDPAALGLMGQSR